MISCWSHYHRQLESHVVESGIWSRTIEKNVVTVIWEFSKSEPVYGGRTILVGIVDASSDSTRIIPLVSLL